MWVERSLSLSNSRTKVDIIVLCSIFMLCFSLLSVAIVPSRQELRSACKRIQTRKSTLSYTHKKSTSAVNHTYVALALRKALHTFLRTCSTSCIRSTRSRFGVLVEQLHIPSPTSSIFGSSYHSTVTTCSLRRRGKIKLPPLPVVSMFVSYARTSKLSVCSTY